MAEYWQQNQQQLQQQPQQQLLTNGAGGASVARDESASACNGVGRAGNGGAGGSVASVSGSASATGNNNNNYVNFNQFITQHNLASSSLGYSIGGGGGAFGLMPNSSSSLSNNFGGVSASLEFILKEFELMSYISCSYIQHTPSGNRTERSRAQEAVVAIIMPPQATIPICTHPLAIIHLPLPPLALTSALPSCRLRHPSLCPTLPNSIYRWRRRWSCRATTRARTIIATLPALPLSQTLMQPMGQQLIINSHSKEAALRQPPSRGNRSHREATVANSDATTTARIALKGTRIATGIETETEIGIVIEIEIAMIARSHRSNNATTIIAATSDATTGIAIGIASMAIHAPQRSWTRATAMTAHSPRRRSNNSSIKSRRDALRTMRSCRSERN